MGETSGSAIRALSLGRPLVVSDVGWFAELPDEVALKVPVGEDEVPALAASLEVLASSEALQLTMSDAARAYASHEHDLGLAAERYVAALEESAGGPIVADKVVDDIARAAAEVGIEPGTPFATDLAERLDELGLALDGRPRAEPRPHSVVARIPVWAWLAALVQGMIGSSFAILNILSLVIVTPIVVFFLLRDWDIMVAQIDAYLPRQSLETVRGQARLVSDTLVGFIHGQAMVCLILAIYYGVALTAQRKQRLA